MRLPDLHNERGIALAIALLAMVVIGAVVSATFYAGHIEHQSGRNTMYATQSFEASEAGLSAVLTGWNAATYNVMLTGDTLTLSTVSLPGNVSFTPAITRLNDNVFLIRSTGRRVDAAGSVLAERTVASLAKLALPNIDMSAALTIDGTLTLGGSAEVHGEDQVPSGWGGNCPVPTDTLPGIRTSATSITTNGVNCAGLNCVTGTPQLQGGDTTVTNQMFNDFGGITFAEMAAMADHNVSGTLTGIGPSLLSGACNTGDSMNWGEPYTSTGFSACSNYFPIMYAPGDLRLSGGHGQGILLVQGDLRLSGGVEFYGPVIVQGEVTSVGVGGHIYGGLMAAQADLDPSTLTGNSVAQFSSCAIARALRGSAVASPMTGRSWAQIYSMN